jgi:hypothetical protein
MAQSFQDDIFDDLATFAECAYLNLVLAHLKRPLTEAETSLLMRAADVAGRLHGVRASG